jgi:hypothetical protein
LHEVSYFGLYNSTKRLKDLILSSYVIPFLILYIQYRFGFYLDGSTYNFINIVPIIFTILNFSIVLIILALYYYKYNYKNIRNRILSDEFVLIKDRGFFIFHKDISVLLLFLPLLLMFPGWFFHIDMTFFLPITFMSFFFILFIYALFQKRKIKNDILKIYKKRSKSYYKLVKKNISLFFEFKTKYNSYSDKTKINILLNLIIAPSLLYFGNILFYISATLSINLDNLGQII